MLDGKKTLEKRKGGARNSKQKPIEDMNPERQKRHGQSVAKLFLRNMAKFNEVVTGKRGPKNYHTILYTSSVNHPEIHDTYSLSVQKFKNTRTFRPRNPQTCRRKISGS